MTEILSVSTAKDSQKYSQGKISWVTNLIAQKHCDERIKNHKIFALNIFVGHYKAPNNLLKGLYRGSVLWVRLMGKISTRYSHEVKTRQNCIGKL